MDLMDEMDLYFCIATYLGRICPELSCKVLFEKPEWSAACAVVTKMAPPEKPSLLGNFMKLVGKLGGHRGRTRDGPPGIKAMWQGMQKAVLLRDGWAACLASMKAQKNKL